LIGDLTLAGAGDEDADGRPHRELALLTEENVVFSGEASSVAFETSTLGVEISLSGVDLGLSVAGLFGKVGSGRENREWGDGDDETDFGVSTWAGSGGFCGVLCVPETRLSNSADVGFLGIPGDESFGEPIGSGLGEALGAA